MHAHFTRRWEEVRELFEIGCESSLHVELVCLCVPLGGRTIPAPRARGVVYTPPVTVDGIPGVTRRRSAPAPPPRSRAMSCTRRTTPQSPSSTGDQSVPLGAPPPFLRATGWRQRDAKRRRRLARQPGYGQSRHLYQANPILGRIVAPCQSRVGSRC